MNMRLEKDSMGELEVPSKALYGANTRRAQLNFPISDLRFGRSFIKALGLIKQSAAETNLELNLLDKKIAESIIISAQEVIDGDHDDSFVVDIFQTGSGTSTNMNVNEVISNLAISKMGGEIGSRNPVHPNDHVNKGQSSNDVIPTAIHIAAAISIKDDLVPSMKILKKSLQKKSDEFWNIVKTGRTHLQDATPIRLGQEFKGYYGQIENSIKKVNSGLDELSFLALGGTAVGTGIGMNPEFCGSVISKISDKTGINFSETENHFQSQSTIDGIVYASGCVRSFAVSLMKIANDIRWLGSGPRAGIGELNLPEVQPGSSIMPGKVNPVIAESVTMICAQVMGNDQTVSIAGQSGNFELNVYRPVIAHNILQSVRLLADACQSFLLNAVNGIEPNQKRIDDNLFNSLMLVTALNPHIGYDKAAKVAKKAYDENLSLRDAIQKLGYMTGDDFDKIVKPEKMIKPAKASK